MKHIKLFENFSYKLNESIDENYVVKPYEFKTPEDWEKEYEPSIEFRFTELNSKTNPSQDEVNQFEMYLDKKIEESESYGNESTFTEFIEELLTRSIEEMFKTKEPNNGSYFFQDSFFSEIGDDNWHKNEDKIKEVVKHFMKDFSTDSEYERDEDAVKYGYESPDSGSYSGTTDFKGEKVFSWSSGGDGFGFGGTIKNEDMLYKEIKDFLTMIMYM